MHPKEKLQSAIFTIKQLAKFGIVGVTNTIVTLGAIYLLYTFTPFHYYITNGIGYFLGFVNSFVLNKLWTFKAKGVIYRELFLFVIVFLVSYGVQLGVLHILKAFLEVNLVVAQILAMVFYTLTNYTGNRLFTFRVTEQKT